MLEKYQDHLDWKELIRGYHHGEILTRAFFDKYKEYIPVSSFKDSGLWNNIADEIRKDIESRIRRGEIQKNMPFSGKSSFYCLYLAVERTFFAA